MGVFFYLSDFIISNIFSFILSIADVKGPIINVEYIIRDNGLYVERIKSYSVPVLTPLGLLLFGKILLPTPFNAVLPIVILSPEEKF